MAQSRWCGGIIILLCSSFVRQRAQGTIKTLEFFEGEPMGVKTKQKPDWTMVREEWITSVAYLLFQAVTQNK